MRPETNEQECTEVTKVLRNRKKDRGRVLCWGIPGFGVPTALSDVVTGPPGYLRAFCKVLALELCSPTGRTPPELLPMQAAQAKRDMQRPNNLPGLMSLDAAVTSSSSASGYNVLSDVNQTSR